MKLISFISALNDLSAYQFHSQLISSNQNSDSKSAPADQKISRLISSESDDQKILEFNHSKLISQLIFGWFANWFEKYPLLITDSISQLIFSNLSIDLKNRRQLISQLNLAGNFDNSSLFQLSSIISCCDTRYCHRRHHCHYKSYLLSPLSSMPIAMIQWTSL